MRASQRVGFQECSWFVLISVAWALSSLACSSKSSSSSADAAAGRDGGGADVSASGGSGAGGRDAGGSGGATGTGGGSASGGRSGTGGTVGAGGGSGGEGGLGGGAAGAGGAGGSCPDTDFDGTNDCDDLCPADNQKQAPGMCGCGNADNDIDGDTVADCVDLCPMDRAKVMPGACGCGKADVDTDSDGVLDCNDVGPKDDSRTTTIGVCGCGAPDTLALCLRHRYSFDGSGTTVTDRVGTAHGTVMNATLSGTGTVVLAGGATDQFVSLPSNIISTLGPSATIEVWVSWTGMGNAWQRIFDFGSNDMNMPGVQGGLGTTYLFLTPANTINTHLRAAFTVAGPPQERVVNAPTALPWPTMIHVAIVIDGTAKTIALYQAGVLIGTTPLVDTTLAALNDVNNWLGRSQFAPDEEFQGTYTELRIYSAARTAAQIMADVAATPDALPAN